MTAAIWRWIDRLLPRSDQLGPYDHITTPSMGGLNLGQFSRLSAAEQNRILRDYYTAGKDPAWIEAFDKFLRGEQ